MKRDVILAVVIATVVLAFTIYFSGQNEQKKQAGTSPATSTTGQTTATALTLEEAAKHNTDKDCWLIIENKVYNATDYIALHPGGAQRIIEYCGKEATQAFMTRGGTGSHSQSASSDLAKLYIGDTGGTVQSQPDPATIKNLRPRGEAEEEFEND